MAFTNEHLRLAKSLAVPASVAIQNARIHELAEIYAAELELRLEELITAQQASQHASRNPSNDAPTQRAFTETPHPVTPMNFSISDASDPLVGI
jgi:hypothetical protein